MSLSRRGFLQGMLAVGVAPAIVKASSIMRIKPLLLPGEDFAIPSGVAMMHRATGGGNTLLTIDMVTQEALRILNQKLLIQERENSRFLKAFDKITIRLPERYK